ncbi:MAG: PAS domain S-box protein [Desulfobacterales bacterium]|nr:PAS domain S-box protein [Desulfobacterales bacterium]
MNPPAEKELRSAVADPFRGSGRPRLQLWVVVLVIVSLLLGAIVIGVLSAREMKSRISEDFNAQQLSLARHAASTLEHYFRTLKSELLTLSLSPSIQYVETVSWKNRMKISLSTVRDLSVFRITLISGDGRRTFVMNANQAVFIEETARTALPPYFDWCRDPANKNQVYAAEVKQGIVENSEDGLVMELATPVYQISPDEAHPVPTQRFSGVLVFSLDAGSLAEKVVSPIRSGKTGYAWVIDQGGTFLYHLEGKFVGENAFEIRQVAEPRISFKKINFLQKEIMLQGKEGSSRYTSGWHRGDIGRTEKLIAFSPVHLGAANAQRIWSVAVAAPISEVQDVIQGVYLRQAMIQGVFTVAVLIMLFFLRSYEMQWVGSLEWEVQKKTRDLQEYARRLGDSEARYRSLVDSADDLICGLDRNGRVMTFNEQWVRLTSRGSEDVIGKRIVDVVAFQDPNEILSAVEGVQKKARPISMEERIEIGDRVRWLDIKFNRVVYTDSMIAETENPSILMIARDITEHKQVESQLFNAQKLAALGELSAGVAHEINNPIAVILGFTEMLLDKEAEGSKQHEILKAIERQGENCKRIVENLLTFARVPQQDTTSTDVGVALQKVLDVVANTLLTRKVELKTDIPEHLPQVVGNAAELEQVFLNIINNAVAAMENGGRLNIKAQRHEQYVTIDFTDTGTGIAPENLEKIFEPFFTTKKVGEGTGLGLSVSYGLVKKAGGDIRVSSRQATEDKTGDTCFSVLLPVCEEC